MTKKDPFFILIAPNVSKQMGGEAMKALHIFQECQRLYPSTVQITHSRNRDELTHLNLRNIIYVEDTWFDRLIWHSFIFRGLLNWVLSFRGVLIAEQLAAKTGNAARTIIWQTEPNSPVTPRSISTKYENYFGPINGNIYYPPIYWNKESLRAKLRRVLHNPLQHLNRLVGNNLTKANAILCAGGERTRSSLVTAGCAPSQLIPTIDCGINKEMLDHPRIEHKELNYKFVHFGRLVFYKGTFLAIEAVHKSKHPITLDIIGRGPELETCQKLVSELGLENRVFFKDWIAHDELIATLSSYRGFILPTLEESNGIVIQECLALGLPCISLDWGGPQLLIEHEKSGYLVKPASQTQVTKDLSVCMDTLATNPDIAERFSISGRETAQSWAWPTVIKDWTSILINQGIPPE